MFRVMWAFSLLVVLAPASSLFAFDVTLVDFECKNQQESDGADEIFFEVEVDGKRVDGWGEDVQFTGKRNRTTNVSRKIENATGKIVIRVYEHDVAQSDKLGEIAITSSGNGSKRLEGEIKLGKYDYIFNWK